MTPTWLRNELRTCYDKYSNDLHYIDTQLITLAYMKFANNCVNLIKKFLRMSKWCVSFFAGYRCHVARVLRTDAMFLIKTVNLNFAYLCHLCRYLDSLKQVRWGELVVYVTINDISVIYVTAHGRASGPKKEEEFNNLTVLAVADPVLSIGFVWAALLTPLVSPARIRPCVEGHGLTAFHVVTSCETHSPVLLCGFEQEFLLG